MNSTAAAARARKRGPSRTEQLADLRRTELAALQASQKRSKPSPAGAGASKVRKADTEKAAVKAWSAVAPLLQSATADDVQALAKSLFTVAWAHAPQGAVQSVVAPLRRRVKDAAKAEAAAAAAAAARPQFDGRWILFDGPKKVGELNVDSQELLLDNARDDYCGLQEKTPKATDPHDYKYKGEIMSWGRVRDDFKVTVHVSHDPDSDELEGEVDVTPLRRVDYGHPDEFGGGFGFRGERA